jgi:hypothetical protein
MSEQQNETPVQKYDQPDWLLQVLLTLPNNDVVFPVTVLTHGFLISGNIISGKEYFHRIGAQMLPEADSPFKEIAQKVYGDASDTNQSPSFIHLGDAKVFHNAGRPIPGNQVSLWRIRLIEISAFMLGQLSE